MIGGEVIRPNHQEAPKGLQTGQSDVLMAVVDLIGLGIEKSANVFIAFHRRLRRRRKEGSGGRRRQVDRSGGNYNWPQINRGCTLMRFHSI